MDVDLCKRRTDLAETIATENVALLQDEAKALLERMTRLLSEADMTALGRRLLTKKWDNLQIDARSNINKQRTANSKGNPDNA